MMNYKQVHLMMKPKVTLIMRLIMNLMMRKIMMSLMSDLSKVKKLF